MTSEQQEIDEFEEKSQQSKSWPKRKLDEIAEINLGQSPKGEYYNKDGHGPHFLQGSKNFGNKYPELERFCSQPKREAEAGDVLISVRAPVGPVNIAPERVCIGRGVTALRLNEGSNEYLYYFLKYFEDKWSKFADGTTFNSITKSDLQDLDIPYPPLEERNKIASILSKLDEKIEVNNRINENIEQVSQTLFRSWFVDFDPYEDFKESKLGRIPEDFEIVEFSDICATEGGGTPDTEEDSFWGGDVLWLTPKEVAPLSSSVAFDTERKLTEKGLKNSSAKVMPKNSTLLYSRGANMGVSVINKDLMATNQGFVCIEPEGVPPHFMFHLVSANRSTIENRAGGSTYPEISQTSFNEIQVAIPSSTERIDRFESIVSPLYEEIHNRVVENVKLNEMRGVLLPKLMSGEIRVNDISFDDLEVDSEV